ncbi:MAG: Ni/Fe-hydrogenase cytochrome b subunit [Xanthomonadales bacterium]|jgi:Ni/Fe-hydrogenase subunit HybB-like protein|nr:Ni/Fe-hydrogenase cytochrome b subunit [Xanthomonadales bacterium]
MKRQRPATEPMGGNILTRPFVFLSLLVLIAVGLLLFRFVYGLGAATNLNNGYPWGLWVVLDIHITAAIGCGAYVLAVIMYIANNREFHTLLRPALIGSTFAYTLANLAAFVDIGRWWNFYQIMLPWNINLNSVMFEIAICMFLYMIVLWMELVPPVLEKFGWERFHKPYNKVLFIIVALGIVLPTMHQSGLGALIVVAGEKISPLWQTPWIGFLFLMSAIVMGFAIVLFEGALTVLGLGRRLELHLYRRLAKLGRWVLASYLVVRFADLAYRDALGGIMQNPVQGVMFCIENMLFLLPLLIMLHPRWRGNARLLFFSAICLVLAGAVLRFNALIIGYTPSAGYVYFPSVIEILVSVGLLAVEVVGFTYIVKRFPILPPRKKTIAPGSAPPASGLASHV